MPVDPKEIKAVPASFVPDLTAADDKLLLVGELSLQGQCTNQLIVNGPHEVIHCHI